MIPFEIALVGWIVLSCLIMADRNSARGFSIAFVLGMMILPAGAQMEFSGIPNLHKENVTGIGVLLGTILFHPQLFDRFRFRLPELLLLLVLPLAFLTSVMNQLGPYDGIATGLRFILWFILPVFLARIHLGSLEGVRTFLLTLVIAAAAAAPFAVWEFRMSPQIHTTVYGYFPHVFAQHMREGFFRPILFFSHALALGRFFAFAAFLALLPMRKDLVHLFGQAGNFVWLLPLAGLIVSQSYGPYMLFMLLSVCYYLYQRQPELAYVVPVVAVLWLAAVLANLQPGYGVVRQIDTLNPDRASSLQYRLTAWEEYRGMIMLRPLLGEGTWGQARTGRATDSQALISLLVRGIAGTAAYYGWWFGALFMAVRVLRATRNTQFGPRAAAITGLLSWSIAITAIDAAIDMHLVLLAGSVFSIDLWLRNRPSASGTSAPVPQPAPQRV